MPRRRSQARRMRRTRGTPDALRWLWLSVAAGIVVVVVALAAIRLSRPSEVQAEDWAVPWATPGVVLPPGRSEALPAQPRAPATAVAAATAPPIAFAPSSPLAATPTPALAGPVDPAALLEAPTLRDRVLQVVGPVQGVVGVAIKDLGTGRGVLLNADEEYPAASLFKVAVMYEVFKQRQDGALSFKEGMTISEQAASYDLGTMTWPVGTRMTLGTALERMITFSDNVSAVLLLGRVGSRQVNDDMAALGLQNTTISDARLTTSPHDMLRLLEAIARGQAVDAQASAEMAHLLLRQQVNDRLPAELPPDTPVAHKTGNWERSVHDVGIVYAPHSTYVIAVLTRDLADVGAGTQMIADLSRAVYDYFDTQATDADPIPVPPGDFGSYASAPVIPTPPVAVSVPVVAPAADAPDELVAAPSPVAVPLKTPLPTRPAANEQDNAAEQPAALPTSPPAPTTPPPPTTAPAPPAPPPPTAAPAPPPAATATPAPAPQPPKPTPTPKKKKDR